VSSCLVCGHDRPLVVYSIEYPEIGVCEDCRLAKYEADSLRTRNAQLEQENEALRLGQETWLRQGCSNCHIRDRNAQLQGAVKQIKADHCFGCRYKFGSVGCENCPIYAIDQALHGGKEGRK
jgi:hypothetical protein